MNLHRFLITAVLTIGLFPALANGADLTIDVRFSANEASIIRAYFEEHRPASRGRRARNNSLPPGIAKNLARGKALPPGLARQALPAELRELLPPVRNGYERVLVDGKVILVEVATQVVHDILTDIILN